MKISRSQFFQLVAGGSAWLVSSGFAQKIKLAVADAARPLPLTAVRLTGGPLKKAQDLDAAYLLAHEGETLDWTKVVHMAGDDVRTASLHVLLTFLASRKLASVPEHVHRSLHRRQRLVGPLQLRAIHAMLDRYLIGGRQWVHAIPPPVVGRYSLRRQWLKRIAHPMRPRTAG